MDLTKLKLSRPAAFCVLLLAVLLLVLLLIPRKDREEDELPIGAGS